MAASPVRPFFKKDLLPSSLFFFVILSSTSRSPVDPTGRCRTRGYPFYRVSRGCQTRRTSRQAGFDFSGPGAILAVDDETVARSPPAGPPFWPPARSLLGRANADAGL